METREEFRDEKKENLSRRVSFWLSFLGATVMTCWYCWLNPVESTEVQKMRLFFKENIIDVAKFIRLPHEELKEFAKSKTHPFYQTYLKSSEVEKDKVKALIHISRDYTPNQYWSVLPAYQYTKVLERFTGKITFADGGTTGSGADTLFTTELRVGDEFQTADENIIDEDSGGSIIFETDERLQHEDVVVDLVKDYAITSQVGSIAIEDFTWYLTKEDSATATHSTHTNTQGVFTPYDNSGISDYESTWIINEEESNGTTGNYSIGLDDGTGLLDQEGSQWFNNNILHEEGSKQISTEPQAFIVGSITNDTSLTVTRKHLGGVSDSVFQM